ncbi:hypothetical protein K432DRAFT_382717 [Lepidopterella palustris CBS 459.81]|uniref:Developmental regulatory protein wetA n=1 Tax=Lepidopterella palustris CBS 459.81 TaxID=1314670 RepID=A0A8E2E9L7_9PEZI|nr:hypothetical protein K432DRAFT_382717 [Lepidopterella palustris CBS 459.81]
MANWEARTEEACAKPLCKLEHNPASLTMQDHHSSIYPESRGKVSASDPELFSLGDLFEPQLQSSTRISSSTPTTPTPSAPKTKARSVGNFAQPIPHSYPTGVRKSSRKSSTSPKMMRPSQYRVGYHDIWAKRIQSAADNFNLRLLNNGVPVSPPPSTEIFQGENSNGFLSNGHSFTISSNAVNDTEDPKHNSSHSNYQLTPLSPPIERNNTDCNSLHSSADPIMAAYLQQHNNEALSALQTPPPTTRLQIASWGPGAADTLDFSFSASPDLRNIQNTQSWWSTTSAPQPHHSPSSYCTTRPQTNLAFGSSSVTGLGISCDTGLRPNGFADTNPNGNITGNASDFSASSTQMYTYVNSMMPSAHTHSTTPPSRSPSTSPQPSLRLLARRGSSKSRSSHNHHRRKSNNNSSIPAPRAANVDFVNFTPDDSRKILTGVAPSGSSKTKARREKEAAEKRRKLSQAVTRAIMEAGGDLTELEKDGLLFLTAEE